MTPADWGRHVVVGLEGPEPTGAEIQLLRRWQPAGVILFGRNVRDTDQLGELTTSLREHLVESNGGRGPLVLADHEGGTVSVLAAALGTPPSALALGIAGDADLTRRVHAATASAAAACGVDTLLAPVADVVHPDNPVIATRAFGREPGPVSTHVVAAVEGLREGGVLSCVKHWPGHGRPRVDSHLDACRVEASEVELVAVDLPPFLGAIRAGVDLVMVGHLQVPALDPSGTLAPCSRPVVEGWLRDRCGFRGVVVTDALEMVGFDADPRDALAAGCDLLLHARPIGEIAPLLETWREAPRVPARRRDEAARRVAALPRREAGASANPADATEARRRSVVVLWPQARDAPAWPPGPGIRWGFLDRASQDRLLQIPGLEDPAGGTEAFLRPLEAALGGSPSVRVVPGQDLTSAPLDGWVVASVRPLPAPERAALAAVLEASGARWLAILGDPSAQDAAGGGRGVVLVPGVAEADRTLLGEVLGGRVAVPAGPRWGD